VAQQRAAEQQAMREYIATDACRMRFLRQQLDDPGATDCGRCDNCLGIRLAPTVGPAALGAATARLDRPGVTIDPKRQWPAAMERPGIYPKGKIGETERAEPGRAVARFTDLGVGERVRSIASPGAKDQALPEDLVAAAVKVLGSWKSDWAVRPVGIVAVGSLTRPELVGSFAGRIGAVGRLPVLGTVRHAGPSRLDRSNSAFRLKAVFAAYELHEELKSLLSGELSGKPLFLLDDYADSGWTLTVVARLLRLAGAGPVYPLVLGTVG